MSVCLSVCMYVCMYAYMHACIRMYQHVLCIYVYTCIYMYMYSYLILNYIPLNSPSMDAFFASSGSVIRGALPEKQPGGSQGSFPGEKYLWQLRFLWMDRTGDYDKQIE